MRLLDSPEGDLATVFGYAALVLLGPPAALLAIAYLVRRRRPA